MSEKKEQKEMPELVKDRLDTPNEDWIEYKDSETFYRHIMQKKKEFGLKFKDEE